MVVLKLIIVSLLHEVFKTVAVPAPVNHIPLTSVGQLFKSDKLVAC